ncbi:disulfide bond formation protein B [Azomonas macrocytogenes]|uniref:Disulfide bond formation protein B n=1 Tax=Azomonas macrocytogenes TaxID=69962 RepID=A0A839T9N2_AZOMA|nr:disulfide bond formation protein B [Azomonas macrocytogenes]MBB3104343.1 disulfide bond formation protein DsbB [Azomonas macrocytogenes]
MSLGSPRSIFLIAFLGCALSMAAALYLEHVVGLAPCPLCIVQRVCVIGAGLICLLGAIQNPARTGRRVYSTLALLFALLGSIAALRQIWLQGIPPEELPSCLPSLEYMLEALPFQEIIRLVLHGTADCADVGWSFLGLTLPEWCLIFFIGLITLGSWQFSRTD